MKKEDETDGMRAIFILQELAPGLDLVLLGSGKSTSTTTLTAQQLIVLGLPLV